MSIVRQGTLPVGSLDHAITLNVQSSGGSHFETVTDTTPYLHRTSPQDVASSMKLKKVVGGTIAWNQLFDDTWSFNLDMANNQRSKAQVLPNGSSVRVGHKYLYLGKISAIENLASAISFLLFTRVNGSNVTLCSVNPRTEGIVYKMFESQYNATSDGVHANQDGKLWGYYALASTDTNGKATISHINLIDLTLMFGSTIADYIYSLEQAHAGDGVAWFKALFGEDYYPYNAGELLSVKTSARKTYNADNVEIGSYALDGNLTLRGIPKLDSNNELYYDGDTYASDGNVQRKYGIITFDGSSDESWTVVAWGDNGNYRAVISVDGIATTTPDGTIGNIICNRFTPIAYNKGQSQTGVSCRRIYEQLNFFQTANTSVADWKTWLSNNPVTVVYELATSTTESADAYTQSQRVGATEEFVDGRTVEIPVGNVSEYKRLIQGDTP